MKVLKISIILVLIIACLVGCNLLQDDSIPFTTVSWKSTIEEIQVVEGREPDETFDANTGGKAYTYNDSAYGEYEGSITYYMNEDNVLSVAKFDIYYSDSEELNIDYNILLEEMIDKYGESFETMDTTAYACGEIWNDGDINIALTAVTVLSNNIISIMYSDISS